MGWLVEMVIQDERLSDQMPMACCQNYCGDLRSQEFGSWRNDL
jgi:hypothetical protein